MLVCLAAAADATAAPPVTRAASTSRWTRVRHSYDASLQATIRNGQRDHLANGIVITSYVGFATLASLSFPKLAPVLAAFSLPFMAEGASARGWVNGDVTAKRPGLCAAACRLTTRLGVGMAVSVGLAPRKGDRR